LTGKVAVVTGAAGRPSGTADHALVWPSLRAPVVRGPTARKGTSNRHKDLPASAHGLCGDPPMSASRTDVADYVPATAVAKFSGHHRRVSTTMPASRGEIRADHQNILA